MVSIERWKEQYKCLASQSYPNEDVYIVPQSGRGLGRNAYPKKTLYKIKKPSVNSTKEIQIVSPVAASVNRARVQMKKKNQLEIKKTLKSGAEL